MLKNVILAGAIAGAIMDIVAVVLVYIFTSIGIIEPPGGLEGVLALTGLFAVAHLSVDLIWGIIFGMIYAFFYDLIPSKGAVKGLYFGLLIWLIKDIAASSYAVLVLVDIPSAITRALAIDLVLFGFFMWIAYGLVLGYLYKK